MANNRQTVSSLPRWLFWFESLLLVAITALMTFLILEDGSSSLILYGIGLLVPPILAGSGTVLWLTLHTWRIKKSWQTGTLIVVTGGVIAIIINVLPLNAIWQMLRPPCQVQCGNNMITTTIEVLWPIIGMLAGCAAAGFASLLGWTLLHLRKGQESQSRAY